MFRVTPNLLWNPVTFYQLHKNRYVCNLLDGQHLRPEHGFQLFHPTSLFGALKVTSSFWCGAFAFGSWTWFFYLTVLHSFGWSLTRLSPTAGNPEMIKLNPIVNHLLSVFCSPLFCCCFFLFQLYFQSNVLNYIAINARWINVVFVFPLEFIVWADVDWGLECCVNKAAAGDICAIPCRFRFIRASTWLKHDLDVVKSVIFKLWQLISQSNLLQDIDKPGCEVVWKYVLVIVIIIKQSCFAFTQISCEIRWPFTKFGRIYISAICLTTLFPN